MRPDGQYSVWTNVEHNASEHGKSFVVAAGSPKKREILLTKNNHRVSARFSYKRGMELCVYQIYVGETPLFGMQQLSAMFVDYSLPGEIQKKQKKQARS